jgi:hypothetical protein
MRKREWVKCTERGNVMLFNCVTVEQNVGAMDSCVGKLLLNVTMLDIEIIDLRNSSRIF